MERVQIQKLAELPQRHKAAKARAVNRVHVSKQRSSVNNLNRMLLGKIDDFTILQNEYKEWKESNKQIKLRRDILDIISPRAA